MIMDEPHWISITLPNPEGPGDGEAHMITHPDLELQILGQGGPVVIFRDGEEFRRYERFNSLNWGGARLREEGQE